MADPMKIRAQMVAGQPDVAEIKVLIQHPMETGARKDASGQLVPVHFIRSVVATHNGRVVLDAQWSQAISKNPFLGIRVRGAKPGDKVNVGWTDNRGERASIDATISPAG